MRDIRTSVVKWLDVVLFDTMGVHSWYIEWAVGISGRLAFSFGFGSCLKDPDTVRGCL